MLHHTRARRPRLSGPERRAVHGYFHVPPEPGSRRVLTEADDGITKSARSHSSVTGASR